MIMKYDFETLVDRKKHGALKWAKMLCDYPDAPNNIAPLSVADMEFKNAPAITEGLKKVLDECLLGYTGPTDAYFEAVVGWMKRRHNFMIDKEWIVTTPGIVVAINFLLRAYTKPGEGVILLTPSYYPFFDVIAKNGLQAVTSDLINEEGQYRVNLDDLKQKVTETNNKILILCSPHNPVGKVFSTEELIQIAELCLNNDVLIIADEIHHDLIMPGHKHHVLASLDERYLDKTITCTSCSKTFNLAGLKGSNIIIKNDELRNKFVDELCKASLSGRLNIFAYKAIQLAYDEAEEWLEECIQYIHENSNFLKEYIDTYLPMIKVYPLEGTYLQWIDCRSLKLSCEELEHQMIKHQLYLDEGYIFGDAGQGFERINLACPRWVLAQSLERFRQLVEELAV